MIVIFGIIGSSIAAIGGVGTIKSPDYMQSQDTASSSQPTSSTDSSGIHYFDVIDLRGKVFSWEDQYVLSSIIGIVNRHNATLYVMGSAITVEWLSILNSSQYYGIPVEVSNISQIINRYFAYFQGIVVFNASDPEQGNIASPLSGVYSSLLVPSAIYTKIINNLPQSLPIKCNVTADLMAANAITRLQKYQYGYHHYFPLCNQSAFAIYDGAVEQCMRQFIIANNLFTFWRVLYVHTDVPNTWGAPSLEPDSAEELAFFERFLADRPGNIPVYGFMFPDGGNEGEVIRRISATNKYLIAADYFDNLPFFNQMKLPADYHFKQNRTLSAVDMPKLEGKIYIAGIWSDGDNIQYVYNFMKPELYDGDVEPHGSVPTGWTINPSLYHLAPYVLKYYYDTATTNDYFIGALSGKGYCKMDYYTNQSTMVQFLQESQSLWDLCDMQEARIWQLEETANIVTKTVRLNGIFDGYLGGLHTKTPRVVNHIPIIRSMGITNDTQTPFEFVRKLHTYMIDRPIFLFFHLHCWTCRQELWADLVRQLEQMEGVDVVLPNQLIRLISQWNANQERVMWISLGLFTIFGIIGIGTIIRMQNRTKKAI